MKKAKILALVCIMTFALLLTNIGYPISSSIPLTTTTFVDVSKKVLPSVVSIQVKKNMASQLGIKEDKQDNPNNPNEEELEELLKRFMPFQPEMPKDYEFSAAGSGIIIRKDGYILTNNHVIADVKDGKIEVKLNDERKFAGDQVKIIGVDALSDLAVIKVEADNLPAGEWGNSDMISIGEWVVALGNPLELNNSVTQGIISAKGREIPNAPLEDFFQTTAVINPGNSGGPLVNLEGQIIGINTAIASNTGFWQGIGFAIPSNVAKQVVEKIIDEGKVKRGYLGILMEDLTKDVAKAFGREEKTGVLVKQVNKDTPAEKAGIKTGDLVIKVDGTSVTSTQSMVKAIANKPVGAKVMIKVLRYKDGNINEMDIEVILTERPAESDLTNTITPEKKLEQQDYSEIGLIIDENKKADGTKAPGVVIKGIKPGSAAADSSLRKGDVIVEANGTAINTIDDFVNATKTIDKDKGLFIQYERDNSRSFTVIKPKDKKE